MCFDFSHACHLYFSGFTEALIRYTFHSQFTESEIFYFYRKTGINSMPWVGIASTKAIHDDQWHRYHQTTTQAQCRQAMDDTRAPLLCICCILFIQLSVEL